MNAEPSSQIYKAGEIYRGLGLSGGTEALLGDIWLNRKNKWLLSGLHTNASPAVCVLYLDPSLLTLAPAILPFPFRQLL